LSQITSFVDIDSSSETVYTVPKNMWPRLQW